MPGIYGLAGECSEGKRTATMQRMANLLKHQTWYCDQQEVDAAVPISLGRMGLGFIDSAIQPATNEDGAVRAVFDGELYDADESRRTLAAHGHRFRTDSFAELLVHGYEQEGQRYLQGLRGKFMAAIWDSRRRRLILTNDRFGMRPLYYAHLANRVVFASEVKAVLADSAVGRSHNLAGVAQFFTYGQLLGEDTLVEGVRLLPAAGWLTYDVDDDRLAVERYWRLPATPESGSEDDRLERIDLAFEQAVRRCTSGTRRLGLSLSGGLDARTILGVAVDDVPIQTVCIGIDGSMDHRSAAEMARQTNRRHHAFTLGEDFLSNFERHFRDMVRLTDGHYLSQCIVMPTLPVYRELGVECLLRGHAGELMHMTKAYNFSVDPEALRLHDEASLEAWLFKHLQSYLLEGTGGTLFAAGHRQSMEELARMSLAACLQESADFSHPVQRIAHLFLSQRSRRETAMSLVKFGSLVETRLPYLDNDVIDALFEAPPSLKLDERIQAYILRRRRPSFLGVTNVNTGTRMGAGRWSRLAGKVRQKVFAKLGVRGYQPYERLGLWLRSDLRPFVQELLLSDRCLGRGLFDSDTIRKVVKHHFDGHNHTFLIMALMTYEMGQREFVDRDSALVRPLEAVA